MKTKMLTENQQKWVDALRSGEYEQVTGQLEESGGYCCLGVACKVAEKNGVDIELSSIYDGEIAGEDLYSQIKVKKWLGLKDSCGVIKEAKLLREIAENNDSILKYKTTVALTELNDDFNKTFKEIADIIEQYPEDLFESNKENDEI